MAGDALAQGGDLEGVWDQRHFQPTLADGGHCETHPVEGDRSLLDDVALQMPGERHPHPDTVALPGYRGHVGHPVDMTLDQMSIEPARHHHRQFQVHLVTRLEITEVGPIDGLVDDIGGESLRTDFDRGKTDPVDGHRITDRQRITDRPGCDVKSERARAAFDRFDVAQPLDDPGEHLDECIDPAVAAGDTPDQRGVQAGEASTLMSGPTRLTAVMRRGRASASVARTPSKAGRPTPPPRRAPR